MATITSKPFNLTATFSVGADDYTAHISSGQFVPTQPTSSVTDISGKVYNFGGQSGWVFNVSIFQDWETANSLSLYLLEHDGDEASLTYVVPGGSFSATVVLAAPAIGGPVNTVATSDLTFQVIGEPVFTPEV